MKLLWIVLACLLPLSSAFAQSPQAEVEAAIHSVIEAFRAAIIDKDKPRFTALFAPGSVTWQSVKGDDSLRQIRESNPQAAKVRINPDNTYLSFIDGIVGDKASTEEKFNNIRIDSDGDIASVVFGYSFHRDGRESNRGQEAWQLVRTDHGWRIVSVIWSVSLSPP